MLRSSSGRRDASNARPSSSAATSSASNRCVCAFSSVAGCDDVAHIPIAHADSLNATTAATVALYDLGAR